MKPTPRSADPYEHPLYFDIINSPGTADEVFTLECIGRRFCGSRRGEGAGRARRRWTARDAVWLEPGCGSGRYLRVLAKRGAACVGVDLSRGMVEFAEGELARRELSERARVLVADMRKMDAPVVKRAVQEMQGVGKKGSGKKTGEAEARPVIAFCLHNSVRHLLSDRDVVSHLKSTGRVIGERGVYLVGLGLLGPGGEVACETVARARRGSVTVREVIDFVPPVEGAGASGIEARMEEAFRYLAVSKGKQEQEFVSRYKLRTYTLEQWRGVVALAGLEEVAVVGAWGRPLAEDWLRYAVRVLRVKA